MTLLESVMKEDGITEEEVMRDCVEKYLKVRPKYCPRRCEICYGQTVIVEGK